MSRRARALSLALVGLGLLGLGVAPGSAQDSAGNQVGEVLAAPPPTSPAGPSPPSLAAASPPEPVPALALPAAAGDTIVANESADDDAAPVTPLARPRYTTAVLQALDKVTAETLRFEAKVGEPVRYKDLVITVHDCEANAANESLKDSIVHMEVQYQPAVLGGGASAVRQVFRGWMFADSPGLHPFANPIYDVWVIACKTSAPATSASAAGASL